MGMVIRSFDGPERETWCRQFLPWVVEFQDDEITALAEMDGHPAGCCRLVSVGPGACELSGLILFDPYRTRAVALGLMQYLLNHATGKMVYAIPFDEFKGLHGALNFEECPSPDDLPLRLREKLQGDNDLRKRVVLRRDLRRFG